MNSTSNQQIVTDEERTACIRKLATFWPSHICSQVEKLSFEKSHGIKSHYLKYLQAYDQQLKNNHSNGLNRSTNNNSNQQTRLSTPSQVNEQRNNLPSTQSVTRLNNPSINHVTSGGETRDSTHLNTSVNIASTINSTKTFSPSQQIQRNVSTNSFPQNIQPRPRLQTPAQRAITPLISSNTGSQTFVRENSSINPTINSSSSSGDRLLQTILLSNNDESSRAASNSLNPQPTPTMSQSVRPINPSNNSNAPRPTLLISQPSPSSSVILIPTPNSNSTIPSTSSTNLTKQQSSTNASSSPMANISSPMNPKSTPQTVNGPITNLDEETINLIKYLQENVEKLRLYIQKFYNEGNLSRARDIQTFYQQTVQFIANPTYENLSFAKQIRNMLERAASRTNAQRPPIPTVSTNHWNQLGKALGDYFNCEKTKRSKISKAFCEPLCDVLNGVPHKKIRLDVEGNSSPKFDRQFEICDQSIYSRLDDEFNSLPNGIYSIEIISKRTLNNHPNDKTGIILRCKLLEDSQPLIPPLRLKISNRYPEEQPEILSLTTTTPPRLEFTDGHPFFEQISSYFVSHLFKLHRQYTITDILQIWRQSVQTAL